MATRFVCVDLQDDARDFRPIAVEPGVPMLDRSNANNKILYRWLGGLIADPIWIGESVDFYSRDDHGGRLEEVVCQTIAPGDLDGPLKGDLDLLRSRLDKAKPETQTERSLLKITKRTLRELTEGPRRSDLDDYFFKYRDVQGRWRLVWCWGYQRLDQEPAPAVICNDPECNLLFVKRPKQSPKCPACEAALASGSRKRKNLKRNLKIAALLVLLLLPILYWITHPNRLVATPDIHSGPMGSRVEFKLTHAGLFPFLDEDVTHQAVGLVLDPAVAKLNQYDSSATLTGRGKTLVRFHLGELTTDVNLVCTQAVNPAKLIIEPANPKLAVHTTARLKVFGEYKDGHRADLTEVAEWIPQNDGTVYAYNGLLEGLTEGKSTVAVRYRANPGDDYVDTAANVSVSKAKFKSLEVSVAQEKIGVGRAASLRIDAVTAEGEKYSVLESSRLKTAVKRPYLAAVSGKNLLGEQPGEGTLSAKFGDKLTADTKINVAVLPGLDKFVVAPEKMQMVTGEIARLNVSSPSQAPIYLTSSDPEKVEITADNRLIARREGKANVQVIQGNQRQQVSVTVTTADFAAIALRPSLVAVPVDHTVSPRVMATVKGTKDSGERMVEISPDLLTCEKEPSPRFAAFEYETLDVRGIKPTDPSSPQKLAFYFGGHQTSAPVEVVLAPLQLDITPAGPVDLPLGQMMRLQAYANYSGGHRVQVPAGRVEFSSTPGKDCKEGLELRGNKVAALKQDAGPLSIGATYFGTEAKPVVFKSVEPGPITLNLDVDRNIWLASESSKATLTASGPDGDVELVPELAKYETSAEEVLTIDEQSGAFNAVAPGPVTLTGSHIGAKNPTTLDMKVYDPANATLLFEPASLKLAVDEVAPLKVILEVVDGERTDRAELSGPGVGYAIDQPDAIRWSPPSVVGVTAGLVQLTASLPVLGTPAVADIEVIEAAEPAALRIVPDKATLAPGQSIEVKLEEQLPGTAEAWREVSPGSIVWTVPEGLIWTAASSQLRPTVTCPEAIGRDFELKAEYAGKEAVAVISTKKKGLDPRTPGSTLTLVRQPPGRYLPVGRQQRYSILIEKDGKSEPVADVQWPDDFENEFIRWQAPILTAKQPGYQQWLRAEAGGRTVLLHTTTYLPPEIEPPAVDPDKPSNVTFVADDGTSVTMPVGAEFEDFEVVVEYPDGFTRVVTKKAVLRTSKPAETAAVTASAGRLVGIRPGEAKVIAEFEGVRSREPLSVLVTADVDVDQLKIQPHEAELLPNERISLKVIGYKDGKSVGNITGLGGFTFASSNQQAAYVDGNTLTSLALGRTTITATLGNITSEPAVIDVVSSIDDELAIEPRRIELYAGESRRVGVDVLVYRGDLEVSRNCYVTPALSSVVRYDPQTQSLVGITPGASTAVTFSIGNKLVDLIVDVVGTAARFDGEIVVEPSAGNLAVGQALPLRAYVLMPDGSRIDRTDAAIFASSDSSAVTILGNRACAMGTGQAQVTASLPGTTASGSAHVTVNSNPITDIMVEPPRLAMSTGDRVRLQIFGSAASGTHEMFPQGELTVTPGGPNPTVIQISGAGDVSALAPGQAEVAVNWQGQLGRQVPVSVVDNPWTDLRIEPGSATVTPGQGMVYQVTATRGGQRRVLTAADGVQLHVDNQNVARVAPGDMAAVGIAPGRAVIVAQLAGQTAEAALNVTSSEQVVVGGTVPYVDVHDHGYGTYHITDDWHTRLFGDGTVVDSTVVDVIDTHVIPPGEVVDLRFVPEVLRLAANSPPTSVRVVEVYADGRQGRDVTNDPALQLLQPPNTVTVDKTAAGAIITPVGSGEARVGAKLGDLTASPLLVQVGEGGLVAAMGRVVVTPNPLVIWSGQTGTFSSVLVDPGGGMPLVPVDFTVTAPAGQGIITVEGSRQVRGLSNGTTQAIVSVVDPSGVYTGLSTSATVQVGSAARIWIEPAVVDLAVGQSTRLTVMSEDPQGMPHQIPAALQSMDPNVLTPDPTLPGGFKALALGSTQVRAEYRGREAFASVTVSGERFVQVIPQLHEGPQDFDVTIEIAAAESEGPLEYRVYATGQAPAETWVPAQLDGGFRRVNLRSPRIQYGPRGSQYNLTIEARSQGGGPVQKYPYTFRLKSEIEETGVPSGRPAVPSGRSPVIPQTTPAIPETTPVVPETTPMATDAAPVVPESSAAVPEANESPSEEEEIPSIY